MEVKRDREWVVVARRDGQMIVNIDLPGFDLWLIGNMWNLKIGGDNGILLSCNRWAVKQLFTWGKRLI